MCLFICTYNTELKEFPVEGGTLQSSIWGGAPPQSPNPYPSVYHLTELPLLYIFIKKGAAFYILLSLAQRVYKLSK